MLKAVLDQAGFDALDASLKAFYKEANGKFVLQVETAGGLSLEDTTNLKKALATERGSVQTLTAQLKKFEGIENIDELKTAQDRLTELEKAATPNAKVEELLKQREQSLRTTHEKAMKKAEDEKSGLKTALDNIMIDQAATTALVEAKGKVNLLLPHVRSRMRTRQDANGKFISEVLDENGNPRVGDSSGSPMSVKQLVEEMRQSPDYQIAFEASGSTGTGAGGGKGSGGNGNNNGGSGGAKPKSIRINSGNTTLATGDLESIASGATSVEMADS